MNGSFSNADTAVGECLRADLEKVKKDIHVSLVWIVSGCVKSRQCHEDVDVRVYVCVCVFQVDSAPWIALTTITFNTSAIHHHRASIQPLVTGQLDLRLRVETHHAPTLFDCSEKGL